MAKTGRLQATTPAKGMDLALHNPSSSSQTMFSRGKIRLLLLSLPQRGSRQPVQPLRWTRFCVRVVASRFVQRCRMVVFELIQLLIPMEVIGSEPVLSLYCANACCHACEALRLKLYYQTSLEITRVSKYL